jgi:hypothetical protein
MWPQDEFNLGTLDVSFTCLKHISAVLHNTSDAEVRHKSLRFRCEPSSNLNLAAACKNSLTLQLFYSTQWMQDVPTQSSAGVVNVVSTSSGFARYKTGFSFLNENVHRRTLPFHSFKLAMRMLHMGRIVAFTLLYPILIAAKTATGTGGTSVSSRIQPPFPIPANSSNVATDSVSSTVLPGTGIPISSNILVTNAPSSSIENVTPPETSAGPLLSSISSLTATVTHSSASLNLVSTYKLSSIISSVPTAHSLATSADDSSIVSHSSIGPISDGPSSTNSIIGPPEITTTSSASRAIFLPPGITLPPNPSITLLPTGTEIQSGASDLSITIAGVFPLIQRWIDHPDAPEIRAVVDGLDDILPKAIEFLGKLPKPTDGVEPCKSKRRRRDESERITSQTLDTRSLLGGLFKTAFSLVTCVIETTNKVKDGVIKGTTDAVDIVNKLQDDLKPMVDALVEVDPNKVLDPSGSASEKLPSTHSESTSFSSCTLRTVSNCNIECTAIATITFGGQNKRGREDACKTVCGAPITSCGATGLTSVSTISSTTTTFQRCSPDCIGCNTDYRKLPINAPNLGVYSTASNGVLYLPAPTVMTLDDNPAAEARGLRPKETQSPSSDLLKRGLTNPQDAKFKGTYPLYKTFSISKSRIFLRAEHMINCHCPFQ